MTPARSATAPIGGPTQHRQQVTPSDELSTMLQIFMTVACLLKSKSPSPRCTRAHTYARMQARVACGEGKFYLPFCQQGYFRPT